MFINDRLAKATAAQLQTQFLMLSSFTRCTFESMNALGQLNTTAARESMAASLLAAREVLATPQQWLSANAFRPQESLEKALAYNRGVTDIFTRAQQELLQATEQQFDSARKNVVEIVDAAKSHPLAPALEAFFKRVPGQGSDPAAETAAPGNGSEVRPDFPVKASNGRATRDADRSA